MFFRPDQGPRPVFPRKFSADFIGPIMTGDSISEIIRVANWASAGLDSRWVCNHLGGIGVTLAGFAITLAGFAITLAGFAIPGWLPCFTGF